MKGSPVLLGTLTAVLVGSLWSAAGSMLENHILELAGEGPTENLLYSLYRKDWPAPTLMGVGVFIVFFAGVFVATRVAGTRQVREPAIVGALVFSVVSLSRAEDAASNWLLLPVYAVTALAAAVLAFKMATSHIRSSRSE